MSFFSAAALAPDVAQGYGTDGVATHNERMPSDEQREIQTIKVYTETLQKIRDLQYEATKAGKDKPSYADVVEYWEATASKRPVQEKTKHPDEEAVLEALETFATRKDYSERERKFVLESLGLSAEQVKIFLRARKKINRT